MSAANLDDPPVILRRQPLSEAMFLIGGVIGLMAAAGTALAGVALAAWSLGGVSLLVLVLGIVQLVWPTVLILSPAGLDYRILGIRRHWTWQEVSAFHIVRGRNGRALAFDVQREGRGRSFGVPAFFALPPEPLALLLNEARDLWAP